MKNLNSNPELIKKALSMLGIQHLSLGIFDQSLPCFPEEEIGWGSPYSNGGIDFLHFAHNIGFNTIQYGPQGKTSRSDISPYNSTIFSSNPLSLSSFSLSRQYPWLFTPDEVMLLAERCTGFKHRVNGISAWKAIDNLLSTAFKRYCENPEHNDFKQQFNIYKQVMFNNQVNWFERDSFFDVLSLLYNTDDWEKWSSLDQHLFYSQHESLAKINERKEELKLTRALSFELFAFAQFLLEQQHKELRNATRQLGIKICGDLQIGFSHQDVWAWRSLFLPQYLMGAPPSRSNPQGQPWGYPVLDPALFFSSDGQTGPALKLIETRVDRMFSRFDGIRIDHPHGLVCPWVYHCGSADAFSAVQNGARLYSSPDLPDHPQLKKYAYISREQLNSDPSYPRYGDQWVQYLTSEQIDKYAAVFDIILKRAQAAGASGSDILCEVLSTWPLPLKEVMRKRGLGRFCVTQKADPFNPDDIYRRENTSAQDWIMVGNHDTKPIWRLAIEQQGTPWYKARASLLAGQLSQTEQHKELLTK
ncbi:MAG TPA: 4-alpha-glucanotransferase, partial [Chitinispirillaceae bacterium]|nr:4-alpha-glucanotransferase [Chitinispirillaceae bacterium]